MKGLQGGHGRHTGLDGLPITLVDRVRDFDAGDLAHQHTRCPGLAGLVLADGVAETAEAHVLALAEVQATRLGDVEPEGLADSWLGHAGFLLDFFVIHDPGQIEDSAAHYEASAPGVGFAAGGGVAKAVEEVIHRIRPEVEVKTVAAEGLDECRKMLRVARTGKSRLGFGAG